MFNAEEIIELEKKWFKYKVKQKSKSYLLFILFLIISLGIAYQLYLKKDINTNLGYTKTVEKKLLVKKQTAEPKVKEYIPIKPIDQNKTKEIKSNLIDKNITKDVKITSIDKNIIINKKFEKPIKTATKIVKKSYYLQLEPTEQANELFSSNGSLSFNSPLKKEIKTLEKNNIVIKPIREIENEKIQIKNAEPKSSISIKMKDMDTVAYLKEKFYATSSIVFALMLSEEYYYDKKYNKSLKWALTANDIDSQNTKTWYWFAKSKVKLNKKDDAIRALKAYLTNNESKRLTTLLNKIELGDNDD